MGRLIRLTPQRLELVESIKIGAIHLELRLNFQVGAGNCGLNDVEAPTWHPKIHVFAVAHFNVQPVHTCRLQILDLCTQHRIVCPEQSGSYFTFLRNFSDGIAHKFYLS